MTRGFILIASMLYSPTGFKTAREILYKRYESVVKLMVFARWGSGEHNGRMGMRPGTRGECCEDPGMSRLRAPGFLSFTAVFRDRLPVFRSLSDIRTRIQVTIGYFCVRKVSDRDLDSVAAPDSDLAVACC